MFKKKIKAIKFILLHPYTTFQKYINLIWFRTFICFMVVTLVPLILLTVLASNKTSKAVYEQATRFSKELVKETARNMEFKIDSLQNILIEIAYMPDILKITEQQNSQEYEKSTQFSKIYSELRLKISYKLNSNRDITDVLLYSGKENKRKILYGDNNLPFKLKPEVEEQIIKEAYEKQGGMIFHAMSGKHQSRESFRLRQDERLGIDRFIIISRAITSIPEGEIQGILMMRLNVKYFGEHLKEITVGQGAQFMILDDKRKNLVITTDPKLFPLSREMTAEEKPEGMHKMFAVTGDRPDEDILRQLQTHEISGENYGFLNIEGGKYIIYSAPIGNVGWHIYSLVPRDTLDEEADSIVFTFALIALPLVLFIVLGIKVFHSVFNKPLIDLVLAMNAAEKNNLNVEVKNSSQDEIGQAARSFNHMLARIRELIQDVKEHEQSKRMAELAALQAQVNPHFLSNTLNTARLMAQAQKAENIDELLAALIDLLHISMDMKSDTIQLKEEISYIKSYIEIAKYKQYNSFEVQYHIDPDLEELRVPKLILLPIVENALLHGIHGIHGKGHIIIRVSSCGDNIHITVSDNGNGIPAEQIPFLLEEKGTVNKKRFSGIGLPNVNERIKRIYGNEYGLYIDSILGMYTTIEVIIPKQWGDNVD